MGYDQEVDSYAIAPVGLAVGNDEPSINRAKALLSNDSLSPELDRSLKEAEIVESPSSDKGMEPQREQP